jgi:hypothetical protein
MRRGESKSAFLETTQKKKLKISIEIGVDNRSAY